MTHGKTQHSWKNENFLLMNELKTVKNILSMNVVAVVGLSPNPARPSNRVASYLQRVGFKIIPVNPGHRKILGETCYPSLKEIREKVDAVNVFRKPEYVDAVVEDAIWIGAKAVWLQDGIVNEMAARRAEEAGLLVVMNDCMLRRHRQLSGSDTL